MPSARTLQAGKAVIKMVLSTGGIDNQMRKLQDRMGRLGSSLASVGTRIAGAGLALGGAFVPAIMAASALEETMNKFNIVFGDNAKKVKTWGDNFAGEVGRSKKQIAEFLASSQDLFIPLGFEPGAATNLSKQITGLAVDLASFNNMADADTMRDLQAALTGSGEVMKKYGVIVSEAAVKQELLNKGIDPKIATNQQKVQARFNIILAGTTAAQGDAIRSAESFANQMKRLKANIADVSAEIGNVLLPVITPLIAKFTEFIKPISEWVRANTEAVITTAKVAAGMVAFGAATAAVGKIVTSVSMALTAMRAAMTFLIAHPAIAALTAFVAVVVALNFAFNDAATEAANLAQSMDKLLEKGDGLRQTDQLRLERLQQLAEKEKLNANEVERAAELAGQLSDSYGDLGITVDKTTGAISGMATAQGKLNAAMQEAAVAEIDEELAKNAALFQATHRDIARSGGLVDKASEAIFGGDAEAGLKDQSRALQATRKALLARRSALTAGDNEALTGPKKSDNDKLVREIAADKFAQAMASPAVAKEGASIGKEIGGSILDSLIDGADKLREGISKGAGFLQDSITQGFDAIERIQQATTAMVSGREAASVATGPQQALFDTQFAGRIFGAAGSEDTRLLKMIATNTKKFNELPPGIPVE